MRGQLGDPCLSTCESDVCRFSLYRGAGDDNEAIACWDEDGLYCHSETSECTAVVPPGQLCESFGECGASGECSNGACLLAGGLGEDCSVTNGYCQSTLYCDSTTQACVKLSIAWSGSCEL